MIFSYGGFNHDANECWITRFRAEAVRTPRGYVRSYRRSISFSGRIIGNQSQITTALAARMTAYSFQGGNFAVYDNSNNTTPIYFNSAASMGGTVVSGPVNLRNVTDAQYGTYLEYDCSVEAEFAAAEAGAAILDYQEVLSFSGGLPIKVDLICINSPPITQTTSPQSPYQVVQAGILRSLSPNLSANAPIFGSDVLRERQISPVTPKFYRGVPVEYAVSWSYLFRSSSQLVGVSKVY